MSTWKFAAQLIQFDRDTTSLLVATSFAKTGHRIKQKISIDFGIRLEVEAMAKVEPRQLQRVNFATETSFADNRESSLRSEDNNDNCVVFGAHNPM